MITGEEDREKFEIIYKQYRNLMFYIANQIIHDTFLAEDAVHQAFIRIINNFNKIEDAYSIRTKNFISIITKNCAIDEYNKRKKADSVPFEDVELVLFGEDGLNEEDDITSAIYGLSSIYKDVLVLKYFHDLSLKEISKILQIKENTVKKRLNRARRLLEQKIKGDTE